MCEIRSVKIDRNVGSEVSVVKARGAETFIKNSPDQAARTSGS